jgi:hypothetical protein
MIMKIVAGALLALALGGCAILHEEEKLPPQPVAEGVNLTKQQGGRFIAFVGPKQQHTEPFLGVSDTNFFALRSWLDNKTGETAHQLYVADSYYGGPFNWDGVSDADKMKLKFVPISRNQISCDQGCSYYDEFAAVLPEDYLRAHTSGLAVIFTAGDGKSLAVKVPGDLVAEQLAAVDMVKATAAKAAQNTAPSSTSASATPPAPAITTAPPAPAASTTPAISPGTVVPAPSPAK